MMKRMLGGAADAVASKDAKVRARRMKFFIEEAKKRAGF
jgi:hypothetical protein